MRALRSGVALAALAAAAWACGSEPGRDASSEAPKPSPDAAAEIPESGGAETAESRAVATPESAAVELPESFPGDVPLYPGARLTEVSDEPYRLVLSFESADDRKRLADWLNEELASRGWSSEVIHQEVESNVLASKDGRETIAVTASEGGRTRLDLYIVPKG